MFGYRIIILTIVIYNVKTMPTLFPDLGSTTSDMSPPDVTELDIAFIMDVTGSMGSYIYSAKQNIHQIVTEIVQSSPLDVQMALIEYRDHSDQSQSFLIRQHDFTRSIRTMESWLSISKASGGGDFPEAVADALDGATRLSWRKNAAKIAVLISDAPPHGLDSTAECPLGHDPMQIVRNLAHVDVTLYSVGCEPAISYYTDFFMALAYLTGGQYIPLNNPRLLIDAIVGGAEEELSLQKFSKLVEQEIQKALVQKSSASGNGTNVNETEIAQSVYQKLSKEGAQSAKLVYNNQTLAGPSKEAKAIAEWKSMAEVRKIYHHRPSSGHGALYPYRPLYAGTPWTGVTYAPSLPSFAPGTMVPTPSPDKGILPRPSISSGSGILFGSGSGTGSGSMSGSSGGSLTGSSSGSYSSIYSAINLDQIGRLVNKELSKISAST